tara:strand:+ start:49 stop:1974 length:1926 start_codon:yes stop_codon:yes gene_type:complete
MGNYLKIKKRKIILSFLLILNQLISSSYAMNNRRVVISESEETKFPSKYWNEFKLLISSKKQNETYLLDQEVEQLERFVEETFDSKNIEDLKNLNESNIKINTQFNEIGEELINSDIENKKANKEEKILTDQPQNTKITSNNKNLDQKKTNKLPLPSRSEISSSEFNVLPRGYVRLNGPDVSLNLKEADAFEALKLVGKLGNYGIVIIEENNPKTSTSEKSTITAIFDNADISDVFNSILLSANLQAVVEKNIIFIGNNILNKSIKPKVSKTFRLNQVNASSVADYLSTLGAQISKVMLISGSMDGQEVGDSFINKKEFKDEDVNSYGIEKGPLYGIVGTADLRLQTLTLIGSKDQIQTAEKYISSLDLRHRQVALTIKIIDVTLSKTDLKNNVFEFRSGNTRFINNSGLGLSTGNFDQGNPPSTANVPNIITGGLASNTFMNWLEAKITNENAKILASPTLILGENPNILPSGSASVDDSLNSASIGRPFKNEGFIKVGETVVTGFTQTSGEGGVVTCTAQDGTAGITFGAKIDKIDDNGYVNFALSPAISSVTKSVEISGCGIQNTLSVRKLDTGSIRVKNGETLILTGVLQDSDTVTTSKVPIFGDIPILGSLFRNNSTQKRKSELIILVTPRILIDQ